jgi:hypothetical protein
MVEMQLPRPRYLKYAFEDQHNLVCLFGAACFSLAFASLLPLLFGTGAELLWLLIGPRLPAFRDWVDGQLSAQYLARSEVAIDGVLGQLSEAESARFLTLTRGVAELQPLSAALLSPREQQLGLHGLLELRRTFLDYLFLGQRVASLRDSTPNAELEQEAAKLQAAYRVERELTARMTIRQALGAVQRSMIQQAALNDVERTIDLRLEMLEKVVPNLRDRLTEPGLEQLTPELVRALEEVGSAEALELTVDEIVERPAPTLAF